MQTEQGEKAYKLLALQRNISTNKAKDLIDSGRVSIKGKRLLIARTLLPLNTKFEVLTTPCVVIFEDDDILALDKSVGIESYSLLKTYPHYKLINRLDKDTSGVILLAKNEKMRQKAIQAFKQKEVEKMYFALIEGKLYEEVNIEKKISTQKDSKAKSHIDNEGLDAQSIVTPLQTFTHTTLVSVQIPTGRTHQIRIHLKSIKHPIIGDIIYNKTSLIKAKRLMLHCQKTSLLGYTFESKLDIHEAFGVSES
ncbi:RluA family pseudouridine synthase [Helicobacter bilis]|nr:RluA family pseudouridine synthase [Helicobacter bilis]MCI7410766.1 RluA family pseudouridine synthase [Helicobacter bilis]MDD7296047.1 RluA family pseudouridine synthase [Helicobacter bilis]MDY4399413.1 RluA family pseudouridine synthase [Helicobacter bilis]